MKTVHFIFLLALVSAPVWGSNAKVDSLKRLLEHHSPDDKAEVLWSIAYELFDVDNGQALFYAERAYHEVWKRGDSLQIVKVGTTYGQLLRRMGKVDRSIDISSRMLPIAKRHEYRKYWKMLLNSLGSGHTYREDFAMALEYFYASLEFSEESNDQEGILLALHNIGVLLYKLNDHNTSIVYSLKALRLATNLGKKDYISSSLLTIGAIHLDEENYDSAKYFTSKSLAIVDGNKQSVLLAPYYQQLAFSYFGLKRMDSAEYYSELAIGSALKAGHPWSLGLCYNLLSRIALLRKEIEGAKIYLDQAVTVSQSTDFPLLKLEVLRQIGRYQASIGNVDSTMKIIDRYYALNDSIYLGKRNAAVRNVQLKYDQRENKRQIALQSSIMKVQEEYLGQQRIMILAITIFLGLVILLSLALYQVNRKRRFINQQLDQMVIERTKELSRHRDAMQHLIDEENGRRGRVAAELVSLLSSLKGLLHLARVDPEEMEVDYLNKAMDLAIQIEHVSSKYGQLASRKGHILPGQSTRNSH